MERTVTFGIETTEELVVRLFDRIDELEAELTECKQLLAATFIVASELEYERHLTEAVSGRVFD